mgnify:CR=1 FL=1
MLPDIRFVETFTIVFKDLAIGSLTHTLVIAMCVKHDKSNRTFQEKVRPKYSFLVTHCVEVDENLRNITTHKVQF